MNYEEWTEEDFQGSFNDPVSPDHYAQWKIEPIVFIMENELAYAPGNVIKYVMRYKEKNGLEDLKKAKRYIELMIEQEYGEH